MLRLRLALAAAAAGALAWAALPAAALPAAALPAAALPAAPLPAAPLPAAAQPAGAVAPAAAAVRTSLVFLVAGCETCTIGVQRALTPTSTVTPHAPAFWNGPSGKVKNGRLTLSVPTAWTPGMSFTLTAPWGGSADAVTNIVTRYAGLAPGRAVTPARAALATRATACWAGTRSASVTLRVRVDAFLAPDFPDGFPAAFPRPYTTPTVASVGALQQAFRGTIGNQEAWYC